MSEDLPPDRERLRVLEIYLALTLDRVRAQIAYLDQQAAVRRGSDLPALVPDWVLERGIGQGAPPLAVHVGGCHTAGKRVHTIGRSQALKALADGVEACSHCRPDTGLGLLD
ncbi:DUF6233 domain-containing protein [Streptomyces sp. NPDC006208]|uniref:DUF6233 domain-containing protein n=1 Tax=Streptomyces sp. NPDC006208 TaxID=3156734 RepID=UPI0033BEF432